MKLIISCLFVGACTTGTSQVMESITDAPARVGGVVSGLSVPSACPVYSPGGGDVDTPEAPFDAPVGFACAVDDTGATYGTVPGDTATAELAVLPGEREVGVYIAFDGSVIAPPQLAGNLHAYAAPSNVDNSADCCAENHGSAAEIPITAVAAGTGGMLLSLGKFDGALTQVEIDWDFTKLFPTQSWGPFFTQYNDRFYINAPPPYSGD
ncbi:MAG TPA: hypothetical protein VGL61_15050 [Kofleriaceae bacterium]|jgi:hypothetical protein